MEAALSVSTLVPASIILEALNLSKTFYTERGKVWALHNVSFDVKEGEFVSLVGPSGCGKTTVLRIIAGLDKPSEGTVKLRGEVIQKANKDLGFVFQSPNLLPWRTTFANVILPLEVLGINTAENRQRAHDLLKLVGLSSFEDKFPRELSGGMQQRAGIARGLVHDPSILLMDEPFGALDAITREMMNFELLSIWEKSKKTICFVTHSISEAVLLSDRVLVMKPSPGEIIKEVEIDLPRPRTMEMLTERNFLDQVQQIRDLIGKYYII